MGTIPRCSWPPPLPAQFIADFASHGIIENLLQPWRFLESGAVDDVFEGFALDFFADDAVLRQTRAHQIVDSGGTVFFGSEEARKDRGRLRTQVTKMDEAFERGAEKLLH